MLALGPSACGGADRYADTPGPPAPVVVGAAITADGVSLDRSHLGAGLVKLVVTNQTASSQQLVLQSAGGGFQQQTSPINPADTAELKAQLGAGTYTVGVKAAGVKAARLAVGSGRRSAQNELLLP
jgi:hypothetical protein